MSPTACARVRARSLACSGSMRSKTSISCWPKPVQATRVQLHRCRSGAIEQEVEDA